VDQRICSVDDCGRPTRTAGLCNGHRMMFLSGQPLRPIKPKRPNGTVGTTVCEFAGCDRIDFKVGLCVGHYEQRSKGQALRPIKHYMPGGVPLPSVRDEHGRKRCPTCSHWLPEAMFHRSAREPDGLVHSCKECGKPQGRSAVYQRYGITAQQYEAMLIAQGGVCAVCGQECSRGHLSVDHDHACCSGPKSCGGCVRGLLCRACNRGLGNFEDNHETLVAAARYLLSK